MTRPERLTRIGADLLARIDANPVTGNPSNMRAAFARIAGRQPVLKTVEIAGIRCVVAGTGAPAAIWLHGGGYVFGGVESHGNAISYLAARLGQQVLMPLYARAPAGKWPAQLDDALAVLDALPQPMPLIGDSAGGHLALHVCFARPDRVSALALIGPNTDRTGRSRTRETNSARDPMNEDAQDTALARLALPDADPASAACSPLLGPLELLPRSYVTCAANEVLADDSLMLAREAALAGVEVTLRVERALMHMWTLWPHELPAAAQTLDDIAAFLSDAR